MQGWIGVVAGGLGFVSGAASVRWRALVHGRVSAGQALWLSMLGLMAATVLRNSAQLSGWRGGGLAATEIFQAVFLSAFVVLFMAFAVPRALAKRRSSKTKEVPTMEHARLESLLRANETELQTASRYLEEREALHREVKALMAELQADLDSGSSAAGSPTALREAVTVLDVSVAHAATVTHELRSAFEAERAAVDRLRAAIAAGNVVGPPIEVDEAFDTLIDALQSGTLRGLNEESRQALDRELELTAEVKARLAEIVPPVRGL